MIIVIAIAVCAATVPLAGGRLSALDDLRLRCTGLLVSALGVQIVIISVIPDQLPGIHAPLHIFSYLLAGAFFVLNRRVRGLWVIGAGGGLNFAAIAANRGVMPAVAHSAALSPASGGFINATPIEGARLAWLGDVFSLPPSWPLSNVFSIGDVLIVLGAFFVLHRACGAHEVPESELEDPVAAPPPLG